MKLTEEMIVKGLRVRLTFRTKTDERTIDATVTWAEEGKRGGTYFGYVPHPGQASKAGSWGCATLRAEPKPFGLVAAEVIGQPVPSRPHRGHGWMVGNPAYDLMC